MLKYWLWRNWLSQPKLFQRASKMYVKVPQVKEITLFIPLNWHTEICRLEHILKGASTQLGAYIKRCKYTMKRQKCGTSNKVVRMAGSEWQWRRKKCLPFSQLKQIDFPPINTKEMWVRSHNWRTARRDCRVKWIIVEVRQIKRNYVLPHNMWDHIVAVWVVSCEDLGPNFFSAMADLRWTIILSSSDFYHNLGVIVHIFSHIEFVKITYI